MFIRILTLIHGLKNCQAYGKIIVVCWMSDNHSYSLKKVEKEGKKLMVEKEGKLSI